MRRVRGDFGGAEPRPSAPLAVNHNHALATSRDGGATWGNATLLPLQTVYCEGSLLGTPSGQLLLSAPSTSNGVRANLTVWASRYAAAAEPSAFDYLTTIYEGSAAYSSLLASQTAGTYLALFERDGSKAISVLPFECDRCDPQEVVEAVQRIPDGSEYGCGIGCGIVCARRYRVCERCACAISRARSSESVYPWVHRTVYAFE